MNLFLFDVMEEILLKHDEFPLHCVKHLKLDLVYLVPGLSMNEEVCMIEKGVHQQVRTILDIVDLAGGGLDEQVLSNSPLSFL